MNRVHGVRAKAPSACARGPPWALERKRPGQRPGHQTPSEDQLGDAHITQHPESPDARTQ